MLNPKSIKLGNIYTKRDYTYVKDASTAFLEILKSKNLVGEVTNISTNQNYSIIQIAKMISKLMNVSPKIIKDEKRIRPKNSEVTELMGDNYKLKNHTDWEYNYSFEKGLKETINWFKKNKHKYNFIDYHV